MISRTVGDLKNENYTKFSISRVATRVGENIAGKKGIDYDALAPNVFGYTPIKKKTV